MASWNGLESTLFFIDWRRQPKVGFGAYRSMTQPEMTAQRRDSPRRHLIQIGRDSAPSALYGHSAASAAARADCLDGAARFHHGNVRLARAVKTIKSVQRPAAIRPNTGGSSDIVLMHINIPGYRRCRAAGSSSCNTVEVRVLSWAPTGSPEQSEEVRETP